MTPCCTNTVTPKMIRKGEMKIGDRIQLDEVLVSAPAADVSSSDPVTVSALTQFPEAEALQEAVPVQGWMPQMQTAQMQTAPMQPAPMAAPVQPQNTQNWAPSRYTTPLTPITYDQMTPYMNHTAMAPSGNMPVFTVPQTPMSTQEFEETIDSNDVQSYLGFMRTQIGRYMRIEQLMGSNNVEQRFGFLVGLGTNYLILQEITTGNILVVDLFTIRLTYIYYSDPVVPPGVPY